MNALIAEEASRCGAQIAIHVDSEGNIVEGAVQAIGVVLKVYIDIHSGVVLNCRFPSDLLLDDIECVLCREMTAQWSL